MEYTNVKIISIIFIAGLIGNYCQCINIKKNTHSASNDLEHVEQRVSGYAAVYIDPERVQLFDIKTDTVIVRSLTKIIRTVGTVEVDETRIAHIQTKFTGWIDDLYVNFIGMPVKKGDQLFTVYSPELLATQEEYLLILKDMDHPVEGRFAEEFNQANKQLLQAAQRRLELWDVSPDEINRLQKDRISSRTMAIPSPIDGIVLKKDAFIGMNVAPGLNTYVVADLSYVWLFADIYESNIPLVRLGQKAHLFLDSFPGKLFKGKVTFVDYVVDPSTRTAKVRFEFDNTDYNLKPSMFGKVDMQIPMGKKLALSEEAVIDTGKRKIIFVDKGEGHFEPREVKLGFKAGPFYQVLSGVSEGESVAISSQFLLDSESRLKALEVGHIKGLGVG